MSADLSSKDTRGKYYFLHKITFDNRFVCFVKRKTFMWVSIRDGWMKCLSSNLFYVFSLVLPPPPSVVGNTFCLVLLYTSLCALELRRILLFKTAEKVKLHIYSLIHFDLAPSPHSVCRLLVLQPKKKIITNALLLWFAGALLYRAQKWDS